MVPDGGILDAREYVIDVQRVRRGCAQTRRSPVDMRKRRLLLTVGRQRRLPLTQC